MSAPIVMVGEAVAGESTKVRKILEGLIQSLNKSTFDVAELLSKVKSNGYYNAWGFNTFTEYIKTLNIKARKAQYLVGIVDVMTAVGIGREQYEPLGIAKLREITSLKPSEMYTDPETGFSKPMKDIIAELVKQGGDLELEQIKDLVRNLKGLVGEDALVWLNICLKKAALDETVRPALELAKNHIGSVGKDDDGVSKDASDGAALEVISIEFVNNPANNVLPEEVN